MNAYDPKREELVSMVDLSKGTVAAADPTGRSGAVGREGSVMLDREPLARPLVRWKDVVLELDVYASPGDQSLSGGVGLQILLFCPKCSTPEKPHQLQIMTSRKHVELVPNLERDPQTGEMVMRGEISIEPFGCTWETSDDRRQFGLGLCNWKVAVDKNVARDV